MIENRKAAASATNPAPITPATAQQTGARVPPAPTGSSAPPAGLPQPRPQRYRLDQPIGGLSPLRLEDDVEAMEAAAAAAAAATDSHGQQGRRSGHPPGRSSAGTASQRSRGRTRDTSRTDTRGSHHGSLSRDSSSREAPRRSSAARRSRSRSSSSSSSSSSGENRSRSSDSASDSSSESSSSSSDDSGTEDEPGATAAAGAQPSPSARLLAALRTASRAADEGALPRRVRKSFFPKKVSETAGIALHGRLCTPTAWSQLRRFPQVFNASDLGPQPQGEARTLAVLAARLLQHNSFNTAVLQTGLHDLVRLLLERKPDTLDDVVVMQKLRDVANWTTASYQDQQQQLRKLVAHIRTNRLDALQVAVPNLPAGTPPVPVIDDECERLIRKLSRTASGRPRTEGTGGGGSRGGGSTLGKRQAGRFRGGDRFFGRGAASGRGPQQAGPADK